MSRNRGLNSSQWSLTLKVEGVREATVEEVGRGSAGTGFFRIAPPHEHGPGSSSLH